MDVPALDEWDPLVPAEVAHLFADYPGFWAIAGGWAIDLFVGEQTRSHADIDIQIDRNDAGLLDGALPGWQFYLANRVLCEWTEGTSVPTVVSDIWCRRPEGPWKFQVMLGAFDEETWFYKRDRAINGPIAVFAIDVDGLPVVAPEIQLLYKSTRPDLPKNEHDFRTAWSLLAEERQHWLTDVLTRTDPGNHWLTHLMHQPSM